MRLKIEKIETNDVSIVNFGDSDFKFRGLWLKFKKSNIAELKPINS